MFIQKKKKKSTHSKKNNLQQILFSLVVFSLKKDEKMRIKDRTTSIIYAKQIDAMFHA